ncbi:MAG: hypothetical protein AAF957_18330 [Planctomycetota bacterium]
MNTSARPPLALVLLVATSFPALAGEVLEVGPGRPFPTIGDALSIAARDDIVLVDPGAYVEDLDVRQGVTIAGRGGVATIDGFVSIASIPGNEAVVLLSMRLRPETLVDEPPSTPVLTITDCRGAVRLRSTVVEEAPFASPFPSDGRDGLRVVRSANVVASDSTIVGSTGRPAGLFGILSGGEGLVVGQDASVELADTVVLGGAGSTSECGGAGGRGALVRVDGRLLAYGGSIRGGEGGAAFGLIAGDGGPGLDTRGEAVLQGVLVRGGRGGTSTFGFPGTSGPDRTGAGVVVDLDGEPRRLDVPAVVRGSDPGWSAVTDGLEPGETAALLVGFRSGPRYAPALERPLRVLLGVPGVVSFDPVQADATGRTVLDFGPTVPPVGEDGVLFWSQSLCRTSTGAMRWSSSRATLLLDAAF